MGLFSKEKKINELDIQEKRENVTVETDQYTVPIGLSFILNNNTIVDPDIVSAFFGGLELISNSISAVPIYVKNRETNEIINHNLDIVFNSGLITKFMLIKQLIQDMYKYGNGTAYIKRAVDGTPTEIIYLPHSQVNIMYNEQTRSLYYLAPSVSKKKIEPINMIHIYKNSKNGVVGIGLPKYAQKILGLAVSTDNAAKDFFDSGCNLSGILKSSKPLSSAQKLDILNSWKTAFNGSKGSNVGILGNDLDYQQVGTNSADSQMIQSREFNTVEICRYLNINPILLGVNTGSTYNSIEQAQLDLIIHTLLPLIHIIELEFNRKLLKPSESDLYIDFDEDQIAFSSKNDTGNYYTSLVSNGIMSINEARTRLGLQPKDGGDDLRIPFSDANQNTIGKGEKNTDKE